MSSLAPFAGSSEKLDARIESFVGYVRYVWNRSGGNDNVLEVHSIDPRKGEVMGSRTGMFYGTPDEVVAGADDVITRAWQEGRTTYIGCVELNREGADRVTSTRRGRGKSTDRGMIRWAWGDIDLALPGSVREGTAGARGRYCSSVEEGMSVVEWAELPEPTFWVFSGSGLYPGWILRDGAEVDSQSEDGRFVTWMSMKMAGAAAARGIHVDRVGDFTRVLRPVGTVNWKSGAAIAVERIEWSGTQYTLEELGWGPDTRAMYGAKAAAAPELGTHRPGTGVGIFSGVDWNDILKSAQWEPIEVWGSEERRWKRPGAVSSSSCAVYPDAPDWLTVFSDAVGMPAGGGIDKWRCWCWLHYGGDGERAWRDLRSVVRGEGGGESPWPSRVIEATRHMLVQVDAFQRFHSRG